MTLVYRISVGSSGAGGSGDGDSLDAPLPPPQPVSSEENSKNEKVVNRTKLRIIKSLSLRSISLLPTTINIKHDK